MNDKLYYGLYATLTLSFGCVNLPFSRTDCNIHADFTQVANLLVNKRLPLVNLDNILKLNP